jgi:hypothetical protein
MEKFTKTIMVIAFACLLSVGLAFGQQALAADVSMDQAGIHFSPDPVDGFVAMNVRIMGPSGIVVDQRSTGETITWSPTGMADGSYVYEAVVITSDPEDGSDSPGSKGGVTRTTGSFDVQDGQLALPDELSGALETSMLDWLQHTVARLVGGALDLLVPSAHAADLNATSIVNPKLNFDETDGGTGIDWVVSANGDNATDFPACGGRTLGFAIFDDVDNNCRKVLELEDGANSTNTFMANTSGDIRFANNAVFIDRSAQYVGIGTVAPLWDLQINSFAPQIRLVDENTNTATQIQMNSPYFTVEGNTEQDIFNIHQNASANSLNIASNGRVGVGTNSPATAFEVRKSGTAVILVDDNGPFVKRQMFILENNGAPSFRFRNQTTGRAWTFAMTDNPPFDEFVINDPFSPGREMYLDQFGNAIFEGSVSATGFFTPSDRNMKDNIEPLDGREMLNKVMDLPISRWNYKDDSEKQEHIGPMGQDFQKIFALGPDDRHISVADATGVALAAIKGLNEVVREKNDQLAEVVREKDAKIVELEERLSVLEKKLSSF